MTFNFNVSRTVDPPYIALYARNVLYLRSNTRWFKMEALKGCKGGLWESGVLVAEYEDKKLVSRIFLDAPSFRRVADGRGTIHAGPRSSLRESITGVEVWSCDLSLRKFAPAAVSNLVEHQYVVLTTHSKAYTLEKIKKYIILQICPLKQIETIVKYQVI